MRAKLNNILLKVDLEQKEKHVIEGLNGEKIELFIGRKYNHNGRERNPCCGVVIDNPNEQYPFIQKGDVVVVHYNTFENLNYLVEREGSEAIYSIPLYTKDFNNSTQEHEWNINNLIFGKVIDGEIHPLCDNLICERMKMPARSSIIIDPDPPTYTDRVKVLRVSPEIDNVKSGDVVMILKKGDYELIYHANNKEHRTIKVWRNDVTCKIGNN